VEEPRPQPPTQRDLQDLIELLVAESTRLDALVARVSALEIEVPLGQVEIHEEIRSLEAKIEAATARLAKLDSPEAPAPRPRGVIGALRVDRQVAEDDAPSD